MAAFELQLEKLDPKRIDFFQQNAVISGFCGCIELESQIIKLIQSYWYKDGMIVNNKSSYVSVKYMYRYHSDGENDFAWGCVYRNFQTLFLELNIKVPSLTQCLYHMISPEKSKLNYNELIGSKRHLWIEPHDLVKFIQTQYKQYKLCTQLAIYQSNNCKQVEKQFNMIKKTRKNETVKYNTYITKSTDIRNMIYNFFQTHKLPIIMDDGEYSYIMLAIYCDNNSNYWYLIGDPHYGMLFGKRDPKKNWNELGKNSNENNNVFDYGTDYAKIQWKQSTFFENSRKTWMLLFVTHLNI